MAQPGHGWNIAGTGRSGKAALPRREPPPPVEARTRSPPARRRSTATASPAPADSRPGPGTGRAGTPTARTPKVARRVPGGCRAAVGRGPDGAGRAPGRRRSKTGRDRARQRTRRRGPCKYLQAAGPPGPSARTLLQIFAGPAASRRPSACRLRASGRGRLAGGGRRADLPAPDRHGQTRIATAARLAEELGLEGWRPLGAVTESDPEGQLPWRCRAFRR